MRTGLTRLILATLLALTPAAEAFAQQRSGTARSAPKPPEKEKEPPPPAEPPPDPRRPFGGIRRGAQRAQEGERPDDLGDHAEPPRPPRRRL
jgi:hypothetical protein